MINWIVDRLDKLDPEAKHERVYIENFGYSCKTEELIITKDNGDTEVIDLARYSVQLTTYDETEM